MKRGLALLVLSVACVAGASAATTAPTTRMAAPAGQLATGFVEYDPIAGADAPLMLERMKAAGGSIVRLGLPWPSIAPTRPANPRNPEDPAYQWTAFDKKLRLVERYGLTPLLAFSSAPAWARRATPSDSTAPVPSAVAAFLTAAARRYDGTSERLPRVSDWQIWVEPNVNRFFKPLSPTIYRGIVNAASAALHGVDASNVVVAGGLSPFTVDRDETVTIGPLRFMREMLCMSADVPPRPTCKKAAAFDVWSHHPYTGGDAQHHAEHPDDVSLGDLPEMKALLVAAARAGHIRSTRPVQFWVTEFSWDSDPPDPKAVPAKLLARWVPEALYRMWQSGVNVVTWLQLRDEPLVPGKFVQSGLYFRGPTVRRDTPKPALVAFRFPFVAYLKTGRISVWGRTPDSRPHPVWIQVATPNGWRTLARLKTSSGGIFRGTIRANLDASDSIRARSAGRGSVPFSLTRPPDLPLNPFGS